MEAQTLTGRVAIMRDLLLLMLLGWEFCRDTLLPNTRILHLRKNIF